MGSTESTTYIFEGTAGMSELRRLRLLEAVFDPKTREWLASAGPLTGRRCLEVGAGAGSIATWLHEAVGPAGTVTALDTNTRYLAELGQHVEVIEGDLATVPLPTGAFDLVHARYVLIHNANAQSLLERMLGVLKPGGALVLEEPDFGATIALGGPAALRHAFENVGRAVNAMFAARGLNGAFGRVLPASIRDASAVIEAVDYDCEASRGGSPLAAMMWLSTATLRDKYVATGSATDADIDGYREFATSPECWGVYYATVRVLARKAR